MGMPSVLQVEPDLSFTRDVIAAGADDLKKCCLECGVCTAACDLAPEEAPFPRQQMIYAQWGLPEKALGDPAIWLCYDCGDCTAQCPKGARPGDVMAALRREAVKVYAFPRFMGELVAKPQGIVALLALPLLIFTAIALWAPRGTPTPQLEFANVFPIPTLEALFFTVAGLVVVMFGLSLRRMLAAWSKGGKRSGILPGLLPAFRAVVTHERFVKCRQSRNRYLGHLLTFWGFAGLAVMGTAVGMGTMLGVMRTPLPLASPFKLFANLCAVVILAGATILLVDRFRDPERFRHSTYFDWFLVLILAGVALTGVLSELLRLGQFAQVMYGVYFVHLVLIFALFLYAPYSKFAHLLYRTVAMAYSNGAGKSGTGQGSTFAERG
jgi:quinone-modifying oxidoreductase subunit QmoC